MADHTPIEWTDATWNPITGCSVVSPGCTNCYAMKLAGTRMKNHPSRAGLTKPSKAGPVWTGEVRFNAHWLDQPLRWAKPRMIFVCAHGDLFAEGVTDDMLDQVFAVMALCPQHIFQVLTKRPERMRDYLTLSHPLEMAERLMRGARLAAPLYRPWTVQMTDAALHPAALSRPLLPRSLDPVRQNAQTFPLPNVWLGVSAEDQPRADERIPVLLDTPAAIRWISAEPLLGPLDLRAYLPSRRQYYNHGCTASGDEECQKHRPHIDWVVCGGESGPDARPMHPAWARALRDRCGAAGVPFFFKQWGEWLPDFEQAQNLPADNPEQSRFPTCVWDDEEQRWEETNGCWDDPHNWLIAGDYWQPEQPMTRYGKRAAGRRLDGAEHNGLPTLPSHFRERRP